MEASHKSCHQEKVIANRDRIHHFKPIMIQLQGSATAVHKTTFSLAIKSDLAPSWQGRVISGTASMTYNSKYVFIGLNWLDTKLSSFRKEGRQISLLLWPCGNKLNSVSAGTTRCNGLGCLVYTAGGKCFTLTGH